MSLLRFLPYLIAAGTLNAGLLWLHQAGTDRAVLVVRGARLGDAHAPRGRSALAVDRRPDHAAAQAPRPGRATRSVGPVRHAAQIALVLAVLCLNMTFFNLVLSQFTLAQTLRVLRYGFGL